MHQDLDPAALGRQLVARSTAVVGLTGVALIHLLDIQGKFEETPYMAWMYLGLIAACLAAAGALLVSHTREAWLAALALPASAMVGYTLTRTTGLPQAHGDVGNWMEPLGLASLFVEGALIATAGYTALIWAAVADGRNERAFRARHPDLPR